MWTNLTNQGTLPSLLKCISSRNNTGYTSTNVLHKKPNNEPIRKLKRIGISLLLLIFNSILTINVTGQTYLLDASLNGSTVSTCSGSFYDDGGASADYGKGLDYTVTFCSDNGGVMRLWFSKFKLKNGKDYMYIHDGSSTASSQITGSPFTDQNSPGLVESSGTCLTVRFYSNADDKEDGWEAGFSCYLDIPEICGNGIDDNANGLIDDVDPDCYDNGLELIPAGSYVVNMGIEPQTVDNALLPYGMIWQILHDEQVPVKWAINGSKGKDGVDFTYNGVDYKGGPFIICADQRTTAVNQIIANWESSGVVGFTNASDFYAPIERTLRYSMNWTLDQDNGHLAEDYLRRAGIPTSAYNWVLPENLNCCNDVFVIPHAEPDWENHSQLLFWNDSPANGGCSGAIWAGCKAVSEMENIVNPDNSSQRLNFLMNDPANPGEFPAVWSGDHEDGTLPYNYDYHNHPIMQFLGTMDGAQEGGAEQIYMPTNGWRPSTHIGVYDFDHPDLPSLSQGPAAKLAFGYGFGDVSRGYVVYEAAHEVDKSNLPANIAAQRAFLNFSFMAVENKAIKPIAVVPSYMKTGEVYALSGSATGGTGNYQYQWSSSCGGTFSDPNSPNTNYTPPNVTSPISCNISLIITDDCGTRTGFDNIQIDVWMDEVCGNGIDDDGDGFIDNEDEECIDDTFLDADCAAVGSNFDVVTDASAANGSYVTVKSGYSSTTSAPTGESDRVRFTFNVEHAGTHKLFARVNTPTSNDDSFWVRANGGTWYKWNNIGASTGWAWVQVFDADNANAPVIVNLTAGENTIDFAYREDGALLDNIYLTLNGDAPTGLGEAPSNCDYSEVCDNGLDDDGDGLIDEEDEECCTISTTISQSGWSLHYVDSEETVGENGAAINAFDGNTSTIWHTEWYYTNDPMPHEIQIDLGTFHNVNGIKYLPRQNNSNGRIASYEVYVSTDGSNWGSAVSTGNMDGGISTEQTVSFGAKYGRYIRLVSTSEVNSNAWTSVAELNVTVCGDDEICDNGVDDDGDGLIDCEDEDCSNYLGLSASVEDPMICLGDFTGVSASASGGVSPYIFTWDNGIGVGASEDVEPTATTTYTVTVADQNGCTNTKQVVVTVRDLPVFEVESTFSICQGESLTLSAKAEKSYTYKWDNGLGNGATHDVQPASNTVYKVTATDSYGCTNSKSVDVDVNQSPILSLGPDQNICIGESITLVANVTGALSPFSFSWSNGLGGGNTKTVSPIVPTTYSVIIISGNGCAASDEITITPAACVEICGNGLDDDNDGQADCDDLDCGPQVTVGNDVSICNGESTLLEATVYGGSGLITYSWSNGHNGQSQWVSPAEFTTYSVTVSSSSGCTATDDLTITVNTCTEDCTDGVDNDGDGLIDCDDPDCVLNAAPHLEDDEYSTCPGMPFSERVTYNDGNLQNPSFSIVLPPANGSVNIDHTGKFTYFPFGFFCATETFVYQVCNESSGCCATATVTLQLGDNVAPTLSNVPADITIGCDDIVPSPPTVVGYDDCPGIFMDFEETSNVYSVGGCETYTITRTWSASDFCGNSASASQTITVVDQTAPELFQVYTLENGKRLVAGIAKRVTHDWKYVPFPISFNGTPMIFTTVVTNKSSTAIVPRHRNPYSQGFELRLSEEEGADGKHTFEDIAWIAVEPGANEGDFPFEVGRWMNVDHTTDFQTFDNAFEAIPCLFVTTQSNNDAEPINVRVSSTAPNGASIFLQEETSADGETVHGYEHVGYFAFDKNADLKDQRGELFGESGVVSLTNAWLTVPFKRDYTKPVIIIGGIPIKGSEEGAIARVRNITEFSFDVRLQEWDYLDGSHLPEIVPYMIIEGSIPGNYEFYCSGKATNLKMGHNLFALDNCDQQRSFEYTETPTYVNGWNVTERKWVATDDCDNVNEVVRYDTCTVVAFKAKARLLGAVVNNGNSGQMRDDLREKKLIPTKEPFSQLPGFPHVKENGQEYGNEHFNVDKVTVCHKPGHKAQQTLEIAEPAVAAHLAHGDVLGECPNNVDLGTVYRSIASGTWDDPNTWEGGSVPPTGNVGNLYLDIQHEVTLNGNNLTLHNNSVLVIENGSLILNNGFLRLNDAFVNLVNSSLNIKGSNLELANASAEFTAHNSSISVATNFSVTNGELWLENTLLTVGGKFENRKDLQLLNMAIEVGDDFINTNGGVINATGSEIRVINGNFNNSFISSFIGDDIALWVENGQIINNGTWNATIDQLCVAIFNPLNLLNIAGFLPLAEDCAGMPDYFDLDAALLDEIVFGNQSGTGDTTDVDDISGPGQLNPARLNETGDNAIIDWLLVELRNAEDNTEILAYATATMLKNGQLVTESGNEVLQFPSLTEGNYYVTVRHRNHLPLATANPVFLSSENIQELDFSDVEFEVMGGDNAGRIVDNVRYLWAGDFNEDGQVIYQGPYNDVFHLFSRVLGESNNEEYLANFIIVDYDLADYNLDGNVIFQGPNNDRASLLYHSILSHGVNADFLANYIISGSLP